MADLRLRSPLPLKPVYAAGMSADHILLPIRVYMVGGDLVGTLAARCGTTKTLTHITFNTPDFLESDYFPFTGTFSHVEIDVPLYGTMKTTFDGAQASVVMGSSVKINWMPSLLTLELPTTEDAA